VSQQQVELEVVIVDDASTDDTPAVLARLSDPRIRLQRLNERRGAAAARNEGIALARAPWVAFLDDDDLWAPLKLRRQLDALKAGGAEWAYSAAVVVDGNRTPSYLWRAPPPESILLQLLRLNVVPAGASGVIVSTALARSVGGFDSSFDHLADWDLWIRLAAESTAAACPDVLTAYRIHGEGQLSNQGSPILDEVDILAGKHRALAEQQGVSIDRASLESYVAKRFNRGQVEVEVFPSSFSARAVRAVRHPQRAVLRLARRFRRQRAELRRDWLESASLDWLESA
jgi:glycosyltransferase involved in cell wall biosynthesis